ncbi:Ger(x)C family spore germination protein [Paenibacillus macerans]|nr:Ger(x)C family spore germination protein [Paenibacillus macerans]GBK67636.1 Ger(x)C family spore germination protein [Paenibacillus macerans]GIP09264.1 hypothetical protein J1TS5_14340 [Paenibacillus macerans]
MVIQRLLPFAACAAFLSLTGCWDGEEVNGLAIVTSAGFDRTEDGAVELTLEIAAPKQEESGGKSSGGKQQGGGQTLIRSAAGETVGDAVNKLQTMLPRTIYWGQLEVLIFGEALAKDGFREQLDYLLRDNEVRLRVLPFITRGKVRDFFNSPYLLEQTKADLLEGEAVRAFNKPLTLNKLVQRLNGEEETAILPYIDVPEQGGGGTGDTHIKGYAVFNRGRMVGTLTGDLFPGTKWVNNQLKRDVETIELEGTSPSRISLMVIASDARLVPSRKEGEWQMGIRISSELSIVQNTTRLVVSEPKHIHEIEAAMADHIRETVEQTVKESQRMRTDIFNFGQAINRKSPRAWKELQANWEQFFPGMEVQVAVDVSVRRIGMNRFPASLPEKERPKR